MAADIDLDGWVAPKGFMEALSAGDGVGGSYSDMRDALAARLAAQGVDADASAEVADGILHRYVDLLAAGVAPEQAADQVRRVWVDEAGRDGRPADQTESLVQALSTGADVRAVLERVVGGSPDGDALARAVASGRPLADEMKAASDAAQGQQGSSAVAVSAGAVPASLLSKAT